MSGILEYILIAIGLAMDAFAVSVASGTTMKFKVRHAFRIAFIFGLFQALMPTLGWLTGIQFRDFIRNIDHWIAFGLLSFIGIKMIYESTKMKDCNKEEEKKKDCLNLGTLFLLAIATSIDALAIGITFSLLDINIIIPVLIIGIITFILCLIGVFIGNKSPKGFFENKIEIIGGIILIVIGLRILITHLFF